MAKKTIEENNILKELRQVPQERWGDVLTFIRSLQPSANPSAAERRIISGADLADSPLFGIWADRTDITDSREFARQLRQQAEHRRGKKDAAGR